MDRDSRKINQLNLQTTGVSSAWWPRGLRRERAAGETLQRRRALMMRGWWRSHGGFVSSHYLFLWWYLLAVFTMLTGGVLLAAFVFGPWITLLFLYLAWILVGATAIWFMIAGAHFANSKRPGSSCCVGKTLPESLSHTEQHFPITPMPDAPLVRVLETVDLSSSGIEHFLDATMTESFFEIGEQPITEQQLPQWPMDAQ